MSQKCSTFIDVVRTGLGLAGLMALPYAGYIAVTWLRYGCKPAPSGLTGSALLDKLMPLAEVMERHEIRGHAPADVTFSALRDLDLQRAPLVRIIFALRNLPARLRGAPDVRFDQGILAETRALGWGLLAETPNRIVIMGAVTQPWDAAPVFRAIPPDEFAAFNEPGYAKIMWTLEAQHTGESESLARTETRVQTTDPVSRERFRRYWALLSPGILFIRLQALALVKADAERRFLSQQTWLAESGAERGGD